MGEHRSHPARHPALLTELGVPASACAPSIRRPGVVDRTRLVKRFLVAPGAVVVIAAAAGYGKSTAAQLWDEVDERPFAWAHLGAADDDPVQLLRHIAASLHWVEPLEAELVRVLTGPGRPMDTDLIPALGMTIAARGPFVLVLDDVHHLRSEPALAVVEALLHYLPAGSQTALVGRREPELPLAKRRLEGEVVEFGADDLVMGRTEATALLAGADVDLDDEALHLLVEHTEGWAAGLGLAALALRQNQDRGWVADFSGSHQIVADYLVEEVLEGLDDRTVAFLLRSSILDRMDVDLLRELFDDPDDALVLHHLERTSNPFLVPLDPTHHWFRYHHLFAEMLRTRFEHDDPDEFRRAHATMSRVFERRGDADQAVRHAVLAGEGDRAADLVLANTFAVVDTGRIGLLGQWLDLLGHDAVDRNAAAAIASAWYGVSTTDAVVIARSVRAATTMSWEGPLADGSPSLAVALAVVRSVVAAEGIDGVLRDLDTVREGGGPADNPWWGYATGRRGSVASFQGDNTEARALLTASVANVAGSPTWEAGFLGILALVDANDDRLPDAERHAQRALKICEEHNLEGVILTFPAYVSGALVAARAGRVDEHRGASLKARRLLARLGDLAPQAGLRGYLALAQAALALGEYADARVLAKDAERARQADPTCVYLNAMLDEVHHALAAVGRDAPLDVAPISAAEWRILAYLPTHLSLQEIAGTVHVSRNTVKSHALAVYRKLGVSSRSEAVAEAVRLGLLDQATTGAGLERTSPAPSRPVGG